MPIQPDGSWTRMRQQWWIGGKRSTCGGEYYPGGDCPPWLQRDEAPEQRSPVETYTVTPAW
nr:hypothetical protein [Mycolicibacterium peregrinum]